MRVVDRAAGEMNADTPGIHIPGTKLTAYGFREGTVFGWRTFRCERHHVSG